MRRQLVYIGKVTRPHGVRGEVKVLEGQGSSGAWRQMHQLWIGADRDSARDFTVRSVRGGGRLAVVGLGDVDDVDASEALRDLNIYVERDCLPPTEEGTYYAEDLIGLRVEDRQGRVLGILGEIFDNGAHEVYTVVEGKREILLPVIEGVVVCVEPEAGRIVVDPPEGLPGVSG